MGSSRTVLCREGTTTNPVARSGLPAPPNLRIQAARGADSVRIASDLIQEYARGLGFPLDFQDFDQEIRMLPGDYAPPRGELLLAWVGTAAAGCVGLRPLEDEVCEMKRLYVREAYRGHRVGRELARAIVDRARALGYHRMRLDTVPSMTAAQTLYRAMGFVEIPPYRFNPIPGALFFEIRL